MSLKANPPTFLDRRTLTRFVRWLYPLWSLLPSLLNLWMARDVFINITNTFCLVPQSHRVALAWITCILPLVGVINKNLDPAGPKRCARAPSELLGVMDRSAGLKISSQELLTQNAAIRSGIRYDRLGLACVLYPQTIHSRFRIPIRSDTKRTGLPAVWTKRTAAQLLNFRCRRFLVLGSKCSVSSPKPQSAIRKPQTPKAELLGRAHIKTAFGARAQSVADLKRKRACAPQSNSIEYLDFKLDFYAVSVKFWITCSDTHKARSRNTTVPQSQ